MPEITSWKWAGKLGTRPFLEEKWLWDEFVKWRQKRKTLLYAKEIKERQHETYAKKVIAERESRIKEFIMKGLSNWEIYDKWFSIISINRVRKTLQK